MTHDHAGARATFAVASGSAASATSTLAKTAAIATHAFGLATPSSEAAGEGAGGRVGRRGVERRRRRDVVRRYST